MFFRKSSSISGLVALVFDELAKSKISVIAYLWNDHCVVIDEFEGDKIRIIGHAEGLFWVSKKDFANDYSGLSLLIFKTIVKI